MTTITGLKLDKRFKKKLVQRYQQHHLEVGIIEDKKHFIPQKLGGLFVKKKKDGTLEVGVRGLKRLAGGDARKASKKTSDVWLSDISRWMRRKYNYLEAPLKNPNNKEIKQIISTYLKFCNDSKNSSNLKRLNNALQALVRNPITRSEYEGNSLRTIRAKGFDRPMIDTGQFFNAIKARVIRIGAFGRRI